MSDLFDWKMPALEHSLDKNGLPVGLSVEHWRCAKTPPRENMLGRYCRLEPFNIDLHAATLHEAFLRDKDGRNWTYLPYGPFNTLKEFRQWCEIQCLLDDPQFHTVINLKTEQAAGMASYLRLSPENGSIEVGHIHFSPLLQCTRASTESMYLLMRRVFDELGYRRYEWKCNALNTPSCRAAQRLGFQFEGIFRQATVSKGQNRDTAWFSVIDSDWPRLKHGFECWLSNNNFTSEGQQLRSLNQCMNAS